ncbi:MAG: hypothetical protein AAB927_02620 [Patescibacteria group bacterium]
MSHIVSLDDVRTETVGDFFSDARHDARGLLGALCAFAAFVVYALLGGPLPLLPLG